MIEPTEPAPIAPQEFEAFAAVGRALRANINQAVEVKQETLGHLLVALLAEGHALVEDYPGVGKTALARALARSIDCQFAADPMHLGSPAGRRGRHQRL